MIQLQLLIKSCVLFLVFNCCVCENILFFLTTPSKSHTLWHKPIIERLIESGHNVTIATSFNQIQYNGKVTVLHFDGVVEAIWSGINDPGHDALSQMNLRNMEVYDLCVVDCVLTMNTTAYRQLSQYPPNFFNLIVNDCSTILVCLNPLLDHLSGNAPIVATAPVGAFHFLNYQMGDYLYPAIAPVNDQTVDDKMNFWERLMNFWATIYQTAYINFSVIPREKAIAENFLNRTLTYGELNNVNERTNVILVNTDPILNFPKPTPPDVIDVGGLHVITDQNLLTPDLMSFLDSHRKGVILLALGSNLDTKDMPADKLNAFVKVLGELPYGVIWKTSSKMENHKLSKNIMLSKWLPIGSILSHPNTKLFIMHGGLLSMQDSLATGVPTIAIPYFMDQYHIASVLERKNAGKYLPYQSINENTLRETINEVLSNPKYSKSAKRHSLIYQGMQGQQAALEKAMFWINFSLKHGEVPELHMATRNLNIFQMYSIDMSLTLLLVVFSIYLVIKTTISSICKLSKAKNKRD